MAEAAFRPITYIKTHTALDCSLPDEKKCIHHSIKGGLSNGHQRSTKNATSLADAENPTAK